MVSYKIYPKREQEDETVAMMTDAEYGLYTRCRNYSWLHGGLPGTVAGVARALNKPAEYVEGLWPQIGNCFEIRDGRYVDTHQEGIREGVSAVSDARRKAAEARWGKRKKQSPRTKTEPAVAPAVRDAIKATAEDMSRRHRVRKCSPVVAARKLEVIVKNEIKRDSVDEALQLLQEINERHERWCNSYSWTKEGYHFQKGLSAWLTYRERLWELEPDEIAPPAPKKSRKESVIDGAIENAAFDFGF